MNVPTTGQVRLAYRYGTRTAGRTMAEAEQEFDLWLEKIKADARVEGRVEAWQALVAEEEEA